MSLKEKLQKIKLVVCDVDGVMTDGRLYYNADGERLKVFNVKDGVAFKLLPKQGVQVAVVSAKSSQMLNTRLQELGVSLIGLGVNDKLTYIKQLIEPLNITLQEVAYIGDDMVDYPVLQQVGVAMTPADGYHLLKPICHIVTDALGGHGVIREACDRILAARGDLLGFYGIALHDKFSQ